MVKTANEMLAVFNGDEGQKSIKTSEYTLHFYDKEEFSAASKIAQSNYEAITKINTEFIRVIGVPGMKHEVAEQKEVCRIEVKLTQNSCITIFVCVQSIRTRLTNYL